MTHQIPSDARPFQIIRVILVVTSVSFIYAFIRYMVFKGDPVDHLPMYVGNKVVSMVALFLLGVSNVSIVNEVRRTTGLAAFTIVGLHVVMSQALLSPRYYGKLFLAPDGSQGYALNGELSLLAGSLGFMGLFLLAWPKAPGSGGQWKIYIPWISRSVLFLVALHCMFYGWSGWWKPWNWPGYMPPITLLSFLYAIGALLLGLYTQRAFSKDETH